MSASPETTRLAGRVAAAVELAPDAIGHVYGVAKDRISTLVNRLYPNA